jgi:hypothetical protein
MPGDQGLKNEAEKYLKTEGRERAEARTKLRDI